jgi:hypothetical protein
MLLAPDHFPTMDLAAKVVLGQCSSWMFVSAYFQPLLYASVVLGII